MFRTACDYLASKAGLDAEADSPPSEEDSSKENSLINGQNQFPSSSPSKGSPTVGSPWGHTLTPRAAGSTHPPQRLVLNGTATTTPKQNVPWNDLSFAAEVVSPGFANRVVREAQALLQEPCRGSTAIPCWYQTIYLAFLYLEH
ncbi:uncharacterized protein LOC121857962 [Homarus americanus]|uniref:uncharacterized protein LOC121857962 n=1 Tax=Homarus americanus TaxID=6706 RepID=UPI001C4552E6|nr:uncharacterized protein LOC121857962 [Homarus americanus]